MPPSGLLISSGADSGYFPLLRDTVSVDTGATPRRGDRYPRFRARTRATGLAGRAGCPLGSARLGSSTSRAASTPQKRARRSSRGPFCGAISPVTRPICGSMRMHGCRTGAPSSSTLRRPGATSSRSPRRSIAPISATTSGPSFSAGRSPGNAIARPSAGGSPIGSAATRSSIAGSLRSITMPRIGTPGHGSSGKSLQRTRFFYIEQTALNYVIFAEHLPVNFLPAYCNWMPGDAAPAFDGAGGMFVEPYAPHEVIGVMHLAGESREVAHLPAAAAGRRRNRDLAAVQRDPCPVLTPSGAARRRGERLRRAPLASPRRRLRRRGPSRPRCRSRNRCQR